MGTGLGIFLAYRWGLSAVAKCTGKERALRIVLGCVAAFLLSAALRLVSSELLLLAYLKHYLLGFGIGLGGTALAHWRLAQQHHGTQSNQRHGKPSS